MLSNLGLFSKPEVAITKHCRGHIPPTRGANVGPSEHTYLSNKDWKTRDHDILIRLTDKKTLMARPRSSNL